MVEIKKRDLNKKAEDYRKRGFIPGVLYGPEIGNFPIFIPEKDFLKNLNQIHQRFEFKFEGKNLFGIIQEIQKDPLTSKPIHFDIYVPLISKTVTTAIPVIIKGEEEIIRQGYAVNKLLNEIEIEGLVEKLPENITIDVSNLSLGESIYIKDIQPQDNSFKITIHPETPVVTIIEISSEEKSEGE